MYFPLHKFTNLDVLDPVQKVSKLVQIEICNKLPVFFFFTRLPCPCFFKAAKRRMQQQNLYLRTTKCVPHFPKYIWTYHHNVSPLPKCEPTFQNENHTFQSDWAPVNSASNQQSLKSTILAQQNVCVGPGGCILEMCWTMILKLEVTKNIVRFPNCMVYKLEEVG